jgi:hypothetical protein
MKKKEYQAILEPIMEQYRQKPYSFWESLVEKEQITFEGTTESGREYQVEIDPIWDDKSKGNIRVCFMIDDGGWRAYCPVGNSFIIAPDGSFVGEQGGGGSSSARGH